MIEITVTSPDLERMVVRLDQFSSAMPSRIRRFMTWAGLIVKRQIMQNLSGSSHSKGAAMRVPVIGARGKYTRLPYADMAPGNPFPGRVTGNLMASVRSDVDADGLAVHVGPHAVYAAIQEFGGSAGRYHSTWIPPRSYVWPAWEERQAEILDQAAVIIFGGLA